MSERSILSRRARSVLVAATLFLSALAVFAPALNNGFVSYDDEEYVAQNPHVLGGITPEGVHWALGANVSGHWHPLTLLSLQLDADLYGGAPWGFHLTSIVLHALSTVLVFGVFARMTGRPWPSAVLAAGFALHPLRVESVAWVAERKDVLSTLFWMTTLGAYVCWTERPTLGRYALLLTSLTLGLLAKAMLVTLPFVFILLDYWPLGRLQSNLNGERRAAGAGGDAWRPSLWRLLLEKLPLLILAAAAAVMTVISQQQGGALEPLAAWPLWFRVAGALRASVAYLGMIAWPSGLAAIYPLPRAAPPLWLVSLTLAFLVAITLVVVRLRRRAPYLLVGWLWYLITLVPVSGLAQAGLQALADRYTYVPSLGIGLALVFGLADLARRWRARLLLGVAAAALLATWSLLTVRQIGWWRDSETLFRHALEVTRDNYVAHHHLGRALASRSKQDAIVEYQRAIEVRPDYALAYNSLGLALAAQGDLAAARAAYERALDLDPTYANARVNLGLVLATQGKMDEAIREYEAALASRPDHALAHLNLGMALLRLGRLDDAHAHLEHAVAERPDLPDGQEQLGAVLDLLGRPADARPALARAAAMRPDDARVAALLAHVHLELGQPEPARTWYARAFDRARDWPQAMARTAWRLATHPDERLRNGPLALRLARTACEGTEFEEPELLDALAAAHAACGQFDAAAREAGRALERLPAGSPQHEALLEHRRAYERHEPVRAGG
jgi:tetratricopeptide (TPR) repeat protein